MHPPFQGQEGARIAYIRQIPMDQLPPDLREGLPQLGAVYGIHSPEGEVLALAADRPLAFAVARSNDLEPVSAH